MALSESTGTDGTKVSSSISRIFSGMSTGDSMGYTVLLSEDEILRDAIILFL